MPFDDEMSLRRDIDAAATPPRRLRPRQAPRGPRRGPAPRLVLLAFAAAARAQPVYDGDVCLLNCDATSKFAEPRTTPCRWRWLPRGSSTIPAWKTEAFYLQQNQSWELCPQIATDALAGPAPSALWGPPVVGVDVCPYAGADKARFRVAPPRPGVVAHDALFVLADSAALGHFPMSLVSFFSFLEGLATEGGPLRRVLYTFEDPALAKNAEANPLFKRYFGPWLQATAAYAHAAWGLAVTRFDEATLPATAAAATTCFARLGFRHCRAPPCGVNGGHCAAWFARPATFGCFRDFLKASLGVDARASVRRDASARVLVYDRGAGARRRFASVGAVVNATDAALARAGFPSVHATLFTFSSRCDKGAVGCDFQSSCALFADQDIIVAVHGAALSNLVCLRPGATVIEIAPGGPTMFLPLAVQAGGRPCPLSGVYNADAHTMTLPAHLAGFDACVAAHFRPDPAS